MNMSIQFDTLRYVERLKAAGISEAHAKAEAEALVAALNESTSGTLATKDDINAIKLDMADLKSEVKLTKWMNVTIIAGVISLVMKTFF